MRDKSWRFAVQVNCYPRTFIFGCRLEAYRWVPDWLSIALFVSFWHRTYRFWLYRIGEG